MDLCYSHETVSTKLLKDNNGNSRGVGFVKFRTRKVAQLIKDLCHNMNIPGSDFPLQVRFADSDEQKLLKATFGKPMYPYPMPIDYFQYNQMYFNPYQDHLYYSP